MSTISERLQWILTNRRRPDGSEWDRKALSEAAGLAPNHVGQFINGKVKSGNNSTLLKIARAAQVNPLWLSSGDGSPDDEHTPLATEDPTPINTNLVGFREVARIDRMAHPDITDEEEEAVARAAAFLLKRPPIEGDLWELVQQVRRMNDLSTLATKLAAHQARVRDLIAQLPDQAARERAALDLKAQRSRPKR